MKPEYNSCFHIKTDSAQLNQTTLPKQCNSLVFALPRTNASKFKHLRLYTFCATAKPEQRIYKIWSLVVESSFLCSFGRVVLRLSQAFFVLLLKPPLIFNPHMRFVGYMGTIFFSNTMKRSSPGFLKKRWVGGPTFQTQCD
jgi:hypothetical protein